MESSSSKKSRVAQMYGIPTYDALFKHVLSNDSIRPSFFNAFLPGLNITSSKRLDDHMNPLQDLQLLCEFIHRKDTAATFQRIGSVANVCVGSLDPTTSSFVKDIDATCTLHEIIGHFEDMKKAFPKASYNGTMDFCCSLNTGEFALVEMQVVPQDFWDRRALCYVAAFFGNQLRKGGKWKDDIKKVIGINILGGGKDDFIHWKDYPVQYIRVYKFQEQHNGSDIKMCMDGMELIQ